MQIFELWKGLASEESLQLCICPFQGANQTVGRRWIMDVVVMIALKCREREKMQEFFLNQVKCLNWPYFVYRSSLEIPTVHTTRVCCLASTASQSLHTQNQNIGTGIYRGMYMPHSDLTQLPTDQNKLTVLSQHEGSISTFTNTFSNQLIF